MSETPPEQPSGPAPEPPPEPSPTATPPPEPAEAPRAVLRRSRDDRVIAGVCGGLGRHFGIDPVILRLVFVILLLAGGSGILLYVVGWIAIPEERPGDALGAPVREGERTGGGAEVIGIVLVALGGFFLLREVFPDVFDSDYVWPVLLIVIGLVVLARAAKR
jgi:phage shock protein PspC (stress-responsive transcriptional regulator)